MSTTYALDRATMGSIMSFQYTNIGRSTSKPYMVRGMAPVRGPRVVLLLTKNWMNKLHGLKVVGLTAVEQEQLQLMFRSIYQNGTDFYEPLMAQINKRRSQLEILTKQRTYLLSQQQKVVMRPQAEVEAAQTPGLMNRGVALAKKAFGSVIGRVKTFGKTPVQTQPISSVDPFIEQEVASNQQALALSQQELDQWIAHLEAQKSKFAQIGKVPRDPYRMYHEVIKPMIGRDRMPDIYRKYNLDRLSHPRIIKSPGILYV